MIKKLDLKICSFNFAILYYTVTEKKKKNQSESFYGGKGWNFDGYTPLPTLKLRLYVYYRLDFIYTGCNLCFKFS